jgi:hypothetical protein
MLRLRRRSRMDKVRDVLDEASAFTHVMGDRRVRSHLRAAVHHGSVAGRQMRRDLREGHVTGLANDRKLRRQVRAMLRDLKGAGERMRRKRQHRVRNALLLLSGTGAAAVAMPSSRRWFAAKMAVPRAV